MRELDTLVSLTREMILATPPWHFTPFVSRIGPHPTLEGGLALETFCSRLCRYLPDPSGTETIKPVPRILEHGGDCEDLNLVFCGGYAHHIFRTPTLVGVRNRATHVTLILPAQGLELDATARQPWVSQPEHILPLLR